MEPKQYDFKERLVMSSGHSANADVRGVLLSCIPGSLNAYPAAKENDRLGVDWWVEMTNARHIAVDAKVREVDWAATHPDEDDIALETWSVVERGVVGWTRDETKKCDLVLWIWRDTGRYCLLPFAMLCHVFKANWVDWCLAHKVKRQRTIGGGRDYHSECVFVPRRVLWSKIYETYGGSLSLQKVGA